MPRGQSARRLATALALATLAGVLAAGVARAWANLNLPAPRIGEVEVGPPPAKRPRRVLLVVIDGLRADVADTLPFLTELRRTGAYARLWADPPTYSAAQYVALMTGVPPRDSGVRTNESLRPAGLDDIARRVRAAGLRTAVVSTCVDWWPRLFPESFHDARVSTEAEVRAEAERLGANAAFTVVHLCQVDHAGHAAGARSAAYAAAAAEADRLTAELARAPAWLGANVVVTADHGHRDRGGHGGAEPEVRASFLVAAGPTVARGARVADARAIDVAPTLAAWLAVPSPAAAAGRTLVELLGLDAQSAQAFAAEDARRWARVAEASPPADADPSLGWQLGRGAAMLLLLAMLATRARRHPGAVVRGAIALVGILAAFWLAFGPPSFSAARKGSVWVWALAGMAFAAAALAFAFGLRRREGSSGVVAALVPLAFPAMFAFVHAGLFRPRVACEPAWLAVAPAFAYTLATAACGAAAIAVALSRDDGSRSR